MSYDPDEDEDQDFVPDYFAEVDEGDLTGNEPKFVRVPSSEHAPSELADMSVADLITKSIEIRNQLATDRKGWKAREARLKTAREIISMQLRDRADQLGLDSFAGTSGTAYRNTKEKFTVNDWESLVPWLIETGNLHILQKRVSPNAVKEIREEIRQQAEKNGAEVDDYTALPPGIGLLKEVEFAVRSPTARQKRR
jgi:hypothetical protein